MGQVPEKNVERFQGNKCDGEVPQGRVNNNPSSEPSAENASMKLIAAHPSKDRSLNHLSSSPTPSSPHPVQNGSDNRSLQNTDEGTNNQKKNYWQLAIDKLRNEDPSFSEKITSLQEAAEKEGLHFTDQLLKSTEEAREKLISKQWELRNGDRTIVVRDQLDKIVTAINSFKEVGNEASSLDSVFAGLPWAGFCVLLHLATSDSRQYMDMVTGAQEVATVILRYKEIEELYISRPETQMKEEFSARLTSLYMNIIRYQIAAASYYGRSTTLRFLRAIPKLDDVSDIIEAIRRDDTVCKDLAQAFQHSDTSSILPEILAILNRVEGKLPESRSISDTPWMVERQVNAFFMGRSKILKQIEEDIRHNLDESDRCEPCRVVITGMGGQGKSEICLQIANRLRNLFQGVFWIDVSSDAMAEAGFMNIAEAIHSDARNVVEARQAVSNFRRDWLLVLDNADNPFFDYQAYFPTGTYGVVLMTSRNSECSKYATVLHNEMTLEGLDDDSARDLLLKAANISLDESALYEDAQAICTLLKSHPLALILAGSYVARGHCTLHQYPERFHRRRKQLLTFSPTQAQSRYGDVYATFEASAEVLQSSSDKAARDALELLSILSTIGHSPLPLAIFEATWEGARKIKQDPSNREVIYSISKEHLEHLVPLIDVDADEWDSYRLIEAINCLKSLSLITVDEKNGCICSISIHPLTQAWAKERQSIMTQRQTWITTGSIFAISVIDNLWVKYERQLKPHLQAYLDRKVDDMLICGPFPMVIRIIMSCARVLTDMREDSRLPSLLEDLFKTINFDNKKVAKGWEFLYHLYGMNLYDRGKTKEAIELMEEVVKMEERNLDLQHPSRLGSWHELAGAYRANGETTKAIALLEEVKIRRDSLNSGHPNRLLSQHLLATAYLENGQTNEAISLLKEVVEVKENALKREHPSRLRSQHELAKAYLVNGQIKEAISLLEEVVKVREKTLKPNDLSRLASQHSLATAYLANGQTKEAISRVEEVVKIREKTLNPQHPCRLASQHSLATAYLANGQTKEAISCLEEVVKIREKTLNPQHPSRLASQHALGTAYVANGQIKDAISLLKGVVKIRQQALDPEHRSRRASQHELATPYLAKGRTRLAILQIERPHGIQERILDPEHPSRLASRDELATAYLVDGETEKGLASLEQVVKTREMALDTEHAGRLASRHSLATVYLANGQTKEAILLLEEVVKIKENILGPEHPSRLRSQHELAKAYLVNGQIKEAISLLEEVLKIKDEGLKPNDLSRLASQHSLAKAYLANRQLKEAISLLEEVVKVREKTLNPEHPSRLRSQHELAKAYLANRQPKEAIPHLEEVVKIRRDALHLCHPDRLASLNELATAYSANGQTEDAISPLEEVVEIEDLFLGAKYLGVLVSQHELAKAYLADGQTSAAISLLKEAVLARQLYLSHLASQVSPLARPPASLSVPAS